MYFLWAIVHITKCEDNDLQLSKNVIHKIKFVVLFIQTKWICLNIIKVCTLKIKTITEKFIKKCTHKH